MNYLFSPIAFQGILVTLLMLLLYGTFIGSLVMLFRRKTGALSLALALGPFVFGAMAMRVWLVDFTAIYHASGIDAGPNSPACPLLLDMLHRPFDIGCVLSMVALTFLLLRRIWFQRSNGSSRR